MAMPLDGLSTHALRLELTGRLTNARVLKVFQPWPDSVILHLRTGHVTERLLLSAWSEHPSAHLTRLQPENPLQAPVFSMVLRKHLEPARLLRIEQIGLDRILCFVFETFEEHGSRAERTLVAELTGRSSNLVLIDPAENRVIDALRRQSGSGRRTLMPGASYEAPVMPGARKTNPFEETEEAFLRYLRLAAAPRGVARLLMDGYDGFGPFSAAEVVQRAGFAPDVKREELSLEDLKCVARAFFSLVERVRTGEIEPTLFETNRGLDWWLLPPASREVRTVRSEDSLSQVIDTAFATQHEGFQVERQKSDLLKRVRRLHARAERKLSQREREASAAEAADELRHMGDLLSANLYMVPPRGAAHVEVPDYARDYAPVTIKLDPMLTPVENVQAYYKKYQRAKRAATELEHLLREAQMEAEYLAQVMTSIELAEGTYDLEEIRLELEQQGILPRRAEPRRGKAKQVRSKPLRFRSSDGMAIWVGRNNRQNDQLTLHTARPVDIWFHAKEIPGSHVILRVDKEPTPDSLREAAVLAAYYSKARESSNVPVDYVERKHVRKPSGAPPGFVIYDHHKTMYVTPAAEIVERLRVDGDEDES